MKYLYTILGLCLFISIAHAREIASSLPLPIIPEETDAELQEALDLQRDRNIEREIERWSNEFGER